MIDFDALRSKKWLGLTSFLRQLETRNCKSIVYIFPTGYLKDKSCYSKNTTKQTTWFCDYFHSWFYLRSTKMHENKAINSDSLNSDLHQGTISIRPRCSSKFRDDQALEKGDFSPKQTSAQWCVRWRAQLNLTWRPPELVLFFHVHPKCKMCTCLSYVAFLWVSFYTSKGEKIS